MKDNTPAEDETMTRTREERDPHTYATGKLVQPGDQVAWRVDSGTSVVADVTRLTKRAVAIRCHGERHNEHFVKGWSLTLRYRPVTGRSPTPAESAEGPEAEEVTNEPWPWEESP